MTVSIARRFGAVIAVVALGLSACGGGSGDTDGATDKDIDTSGNASNCPTDALESADGPVELSVWFAFQGLAARALQEMAADYNASQDKVVVSVTNQGTYDEQIKKYKQGLGNAASLPNIILAEDTNAQFLVDSKSVVPAQDCMAADPDGAALYDDLMPAIESAYTVGDQLIPAGFSVSNPVLYYNRAHFEAAGLDPDSPPTSMDELRSTAAALQAAKIEGLEQPLVMKMDSWFWEQWLTAQGVDQVDEGNGRDGPATKSLADSAESTEILTWLQQMVADGLLKGVKSNDDLSAYLAVATEKASMLIETSAAINTIDAAIAGTLNSDLIELPEGVDPSTIRFDTLQADVATLPVPEGATGGQIAGNAWYMVKKSDAEVAAAWDFMRFANQTDSQVKWTMTGGYLPSHTDAAEQIDADSEFTSSRVGKWQSVASAQVAKLNPEFTGPLIGNYAAYRSEMRAVMDGISAGQDPAPLVATAMSNIAQKFSIYNQNPGQ